MYNSTLPLVSVITPTYKRFDTLFRTIDSVLSQDYSQIEYIITDDGSEKFPYEEIEDYVNRNKANNIINSVIIHHNKNMGTVRNLNSAMKQAQGKYLLVLSGDDVFYDNSVVSKAVDRFIESGGDVIITSRLVVDGNDTPQMFLPHLCERKKILRYRNGKDQYYAYLKGFFYDMASGSCMYYSKHIMEEMGYFDERFTLWEDGPFFLNFTWNNKMICSHDIVAIRYQDGGVSSKNINEKLVADSYILSNELITEHYDDLPYSVRNNVDYIRALSNCKSTIKRIMVYGRHPIVFLSHFFYKTSRKINTIRDKQSIKKVMCKE